MLQIGSQRLIQFKRIVVLTDLGVGAETVVRSAGSLARWYGSELWLVHALGTECRSPASGMSPKEQAEQEARRLIGKLTLQDLRAKLIIREASIAKVVQEVDESHPTLIVVGIHGREGTRKWLAGSIAEEVFGQVQRPVLVLGPECSWPGITPQKQLDHVLYGTDLSAGSLTALQYAVGISHDHEATLTALYIETNSRQGSLSDRASAEQRLRDWLQDHINGLAEAMVGVRCMADFGKPVDDILEMASQTRADLIILGARGLGMGAGAARHFFGGTAYGVVCTSECPILIVPQPS